MISFPIINPNRLAPVARLRAPQEKIPQERCVRDQIKRQIERFVLAQNPVPPMPMEEIREYAKAFMRHYQLDEIYQDYVAVLINNEAWRDTLASIPFERRLLLLPKCLRDERRCPAPIDEFGLLCKQCGLCNIRDLEEEAQQLGYAVLVAEGSALVTNMIQASKIEAIVGVSCLNVLERSFPYMEAAAIPGIAIPLLQDNCADCTVDLDWVWDIIHLTSEDKTYRLDLDAIKEEVHSWFGPEMLAEIMGRPESETERIARGWMLANGKRWRPYLTVCTYKALQDQFDIPYPNDLRKIAAAVECFHKASLIHDDIEDGDAIRYGEETVHEKYGVPIALNVGDFLVGEGYRLLAECQTLPEITTQMIQAAARGHRRLCQGQGLELCWSRNPKPLSSPEVIEIFRQKTAPAFEAALRLGAIHAGANQEIGDILSRYSEALGVAYQIRDDLDDWSSADSSSDVSQMRPSLILAMACEQARSDMKELMQSVWQNKISPNDIKDQIQDFVVRKKIDIRAQRLKETYKEEAIQALRVLNHAGLKGLLRRVVVKIFNDIKIEGWCSEFENRNAASG